MSVFGTRPDTIKMAPVVHALQAHPDIVHRVCVTAQHRRMLDDLLEFFEIVPDYDLDVMTEDQTLTEITTRVLAGMEPVLADARPEVVLVHGDTTTSTAAALAAFYQQIPVGHVEAGLRTSNRWLPYPEEMNRRLTGTIASYHFSPTPLAREHLLVENVAPNDIVVTGNTVIDAFLETARRPDLATPPRWDELDPARPIIVVTAHRRENHPHMGEICEALRAIRELPLTTADLLAGPSLAARRADRPRAPRRRAGHRARRADRLRRDGRGGQRGDIRPHRFGRDSRRGALPWAGRSS